MVLLGSPSEQDGYIFGVNQSADLPYALRGITLEPFKRAIVETLQQYLADSLDAADNNPEIAAPMGLPLPKSYKLATSANLQLVQEWPALVVIGMGVEVAEGGEQKQAGKYRGRVGVVAMLQDQDDERLAIMLDRYADGIWHALMQVESYGRWMIDARSVTFLNSEQPRSNSTARGAGVFFEGYTFG